MADKKISQLTLKAPAEDTDYVPIVDASTGETKRAYRSDFLGPQGPQGVAGPQGPIGPQGPTGLKGDKGDDGSSFQIKGQLDTSDELPEEGNETGDGYFVGGDKELYYWSTDEDWVNYGPLRGLIGPQGPIGQQGIQGADGPQGATGPAGPKGDTGPTGPAGHTGTDGTDGTSFVWESAYVAETTYAPNDVVSYNGSSYICILESTGKLPTNATYWNLMAQKGVDGEGAGDMVASTYDPTEVEGDAFDMDNMAQGTTNKFVSSAELTVLQNTSGTNTGDQEASDFDIKDLTDSTNLMTTWSGKQDALGFTAENSANKETSALDTSTTKYPCNNVVKEYADTKVTANVAITGATKTKITYDAKGLVTAGEDATTADIAESTNKKYITDAEETAIGTIGDKASLTGTETLTNKRINPRLVTAASYTTDTGTSLSVATCDQFEITAQAGDLKFNNPGGTPLGGQKLIIRIKDDGTPRALTYDTQFRAMGNSLPSTTVVNKTLYLGFIFNATDTKWDLVAVAKEA